MQGLCCQGGRTQQTVLSQEVFVYLKLVLKQNSAHLLEEFLKPQTFIPKFPTNLTHIPMPAGARGLTSPSYTLHRIAAAESRLTIRCRV